MQMIVCNTQIRCEGEWSSYSRTVSVPTADHDVDRDQSEIFTFVSHEIEEEAIFVELLSGSVAEKFDDFLNSKRASEENQRRDGKRHAPSASAPPFTEMEAELRYVQQTLPPARRAHATEHQSFFISVSIRTNIFFSPLILPVAMTLHRRRVQSYGDPDPDPPQLLRNFYPTPPKMSSHCTSHREAARDPACPRMASRSRPSSGWRASCTRRRPCGRRRAPSIPPSSWSRERRGPPQ